jgi:hypothetical protein
MKDQSTPLHLTAESLYAPVLDAMLSEGPCFTTDSSARSALDAIFALGEIVGRRSAIPDATADTDNLVHGWARIVHAELPASPYHADDVLGTAQPTHLA